MSAHGELFRRMAAGLIIAVIGATAQAEARSTGIPGRSLIGCGGGGCHGSDKATVVLTPIKADDGAYEIDVLVEGPAPTLSLNQGGFNLSVGSGEIVPLDATTQSFSPREVGHTAAGNDQRSWTVRWEPTGNLCTIDVFAAGNAVNGNASADPGDVWGLATATFSIDTDTDTESPVATFSEPRHDFVYLADQGAVAPSATTVVIGSLEVIVEAHDDRGIAKVEIFDTDGLAASELLGEAIHDASTGRFHLSWTTTASEPPGPHTLTARVTDCVGRVGETSIDVVVF